MGNEHPECAARLTAIEDRLRAVGLYDFLVHLDAPKATREQLTRVHTSGHVDRMFTASPTAGIVWLDDDMAMNRFTIDAALRAAGAVVLSAQRVVDGEFDNAFCCVRPPGHHAERQVAKGFCFFNNVAVGAAHALDVLGIERIAVLDFDAHYCNGTDDILARDRRVLICSIYQQSIFPRVSPEPLPARAIHVPLATGASGVEFKRLVGTKWFPALRRFKPQLIFISAGFDGHVEDDMAGLRLQSSDYSWVTQQIVELADEHAEGRIVSVLEGGYALNALGRSAVEHVRVLMGL